ncbi:MAG: hypothetical protein KJ718_01420 [Nanoarchaeota archaeon]|nr:hypothetical protein [Nanoarchaeota archaeon]MBU1051193.1 hypothetical protein [Nanoarchaeota archaeon]MBU1988680.1 hypothetical protein [Nanoarchaeota archaeon]
MSSCVPASLLTLGKRPQKVNVTINTHCDTRDKKWAFALEKFLPGLVSGGYNLVPSEKTSILEIFANARKKDPTRILTANQEAVAIHQRRFLGNEIITNEVYKSIDGLFVFKREYQMVICLIIPCAYCILKPYTEPCHTKP